MRGKICNISGIPYEEKKIWLHMNKILVTLIFNEQGDEMNTTQKKIIEVLEMLENYTESELYAFINNWKTHLINDRDFEGLARVEAIFRISLLTSKIA